MTNTLTGKTYLKIVGLIIMSLLGMVNCISLFAIGKKINSKLLVILSIASAVVSVAGLAMIGSAESGSSIGDVGIAVASVALFLPTIPALVNIGKYKNACLIEALIKKWNINVDPLHNCTDINTNHIKWAEPSLLIVASQMYPGKEKAIIAEINRKIVKKQLDDAVIRSQQEQRKAEEERRVAEEQKLEELRLQEQIEKEKRLAEERRLARKREREQRKAEEERRIAEEKKLEELRLQEQIEKEKRLAEERRLEQMRAQEQLEREKLAMDIKLAEAQAEKHAAEDRERALREEIARLKSEKIVPMVEHVELVTQCKNCGKELVPGKHFCIYCGTKN